MFNFLLKHISNGLPVHLVFIISTISVQPFNQYVFSQADSDPSMIMSHSENSEEESITSYNDALIKAPLLVAQCTIVGIVFGELVLSRIFYNRILMNFSRESITNQTNLGTDRRLSLIIILSAVALCISCTGFLMLQVYNLSSELDLGFSDTFSIVTNTSLYT
ncbi:MAG: hypothetical protein ACRD5E_12415, partial [Nitrososphaeraceae archaeon]